MPCASVLRGGLAAVPVRDVVAAFVAVKSLAGKRGEGFFGWIEVRVLTQDQSSQRLALVPTVNIFEHWRYDVAAEPISPREAAQLVANTPRH